MIDPITIIVSALALGAAAGLQSTVEQVVKDAYAGIKAIIQRRYQQVDLKLLENDPNSSARQGVIEEELGKTSASTDEELISQAKKLIEVVETYAPSAASVIGIDINKLKADSLRIGNIRSSGSGANIRDTEIQKDVVIGNIDAGLGDKSPKNP